MKKNSSPLVRYIIVVSVIFWGFVAAISSQFLPVTQNGWSSLGAFGQLLEAYIVLVSAGIIYLEISRRREESVEHRIRTSDFMRSIFHGEEYSSWHDTLVDHVRASTGGRLPEGRAIPKLSKEDVAGRVASILSTFDVIDRFINQGDLRFDELVEYQGHRIWELAMALKSLDFKPGPHTDSEWGRRNARDLIEKVPKSWRERGDSMGSGSFPYRWP